MADKGVQSAEEMIFDANLEEFAIRTAYICGLESNGKLTATDAFGRIKALWKQLKRSKKNLLDDPGD
jgi:hypothetical protein